MTKTTKDILIIFLTTFLVTFLIWLPHILKLNFYGLNFSEGFNNIYRNYDGIEYIIIAKSFYDPKLISTLPQSLADTYYASHFPFYSLLILIGSPILGFLKSMLLVSLFSTALAAIAFYFLVKDFSLSKNPLLLSLIFLILPARWLIVHSVGSSEPTFILLVILSLYFFLKFEQKKEWTDIYLTGFFGLLAQITRPPGVLLFLALGIYILWTKIIRNNEKFSFKIFKSLFSYLPLLLMPLGLLGIFYFYSLSYGDFFAYFHSGDNIHLAFPPYQVFNKSQFWVGDIWLEDIVYIFILGYLAGITLLKSNLKPLGIFVLTYLTASIMVAHRDISRYILPIFPFVLIAYEKVLTSKEFRIVLVIVGLGIYLYSQNFILNNSAPYPNLSPFN